MSRFFALFLLPPLNFFVLFVAGLLLRTKYKRAGNIALGAGAAIFVVCSVPVVTTTAIHQLESQEPVLLATDPAAKDRADAIVVLGAGRKPGAPEHGGRPAVQRGAYERLDFAVRLQHSTGKPILVTGGTPGGGDVSEAALMKEVLEQDFRAQVKWTETHSVNTIENARLSKDILFPAGIKRVFLVTHAAHMPRAKYSFEKVGFEVVPAPVGFISAETDYTDLTSYLPSAGSMRTAQEFAHEWVGLLWYKVRFRE